MTSIHVNAGLLCACMCIWLHGLNIICDGYSSEHVCNLWSNQKQMMPTSSSPPSVPNTQDINHRLSHHKKTTPRDQQAVNNTTWDNSSSAPLLLSVQPHAPLRRRSALNVASQVNVTGDHNGCCSSLDRSLHGLSVCLSFCMCVCLSALLSVGLFECSPVDLPVSCLLLWLSVYLSISLYVCLSSSL